MTDRQYPYQDGDVTVLGPEIFASPDGAVICWKGVNYERQAAAVVPAADRVALVELAAQAMREHYIVTNREEADADGNLPCCCGGWREPGAEVDDENDWDSHLAETALSVLYREWPWLRAEAEDAAAAVPVPAADRATDEVAQLRKEYATWRKLGQRNLERAHEENARLRADQAAALERIRVAVRRLAAHAAGFGDVLDESDQGPWGKTVAADIAELRRMVDEDAPLSPYYEHPECGFHWHGRDGMDIPMRDGQPVCPRCELRTVEKKLRHSEKRSEELRVESRRRGKVKLEYAEQIRQLERKLDEVRTQLGAEILRAGQAETELRRMAAVPVVGVAADTPPAVRPPAVEERHTCHDQKSAPGRDWECQWCSTLPDDMRPDPTPGPVVPAQPGKDTKTRVVAYRSRDGHVLYCARHSDDLGAYWTPVLSEDLPDGGVCVRCGVDVLIAP